MAEEADYETVPESYHVGQQLDWAADWSSIILFLELPFWLMVPNSAVQVEVSGHAFRVEIADNFFALHANEVHDSHNVCVYIGPNPNDLAPDLQRLIQENQTPVMARKCKSVLRIHSRCNVDVLAAADEEGRRAREAHIYLAALCEAHLDVVNSLVQHYRLSTYDYFPYEVSPWDVPVWFVETGDGSSTVVLLEYSKWDYKPIMDSGDSTVRTYELISSHDLQTGMTTDPSGGELELLDALNLMERGDYSGAVRRITTAIEGALESVLRSELLRHYPEAEVDQRLHASRNDFPGRLRQYERLSGRVVPHVLSDQMEVTRDLRHQIVHSGLRIRFNDRGRAQRSVDTGRWIFNWLENQPDRQAIREQRPGLRSLGRHFTLFQAELTADGVVVHPPF